MRYSYPHVIDNGHGEEITFVRFEKNEDGEFLEIENRVQPGAGPPMHIHHLQDESLTVVEGRLAGQVAGQEPTYHEAGETVTFRRGVAHKFWNGGDGILICRGVVNPPHNLEYFLTEIYRSVKSNNVPRPSFFDGAYLQTKYKSEFDMVEIPKFVKGVLLPLAVMAGKLMGIHRKFDGAPEAIRP